MRPLLLLLPVLLITLACGSDDDSAIPVGPTSDRDPSPRRSAAPIIPVGTLIFTPQVQPKPPIFDGEINGFRLYDFDGASRGIEFPNTWCNASNERPAQVFRLEYVPISVPNTYTETDQYMRTCIDGTLHSYHSNFPRVADPGMSRTTFSPSRSRRL